MEPADEAFHLRVCHAGNASLISCVLSYAHVQQTLIRLTDAEHAVLREIADHHGVTPTRAATLAVVRALQERRMRPACPDDAVPDVHRVLTALGARLRAGTLDPQRAAGILEGAAVVLGDNFREILNDRAHLAGFRAGNEERAGIDWEHGRTGTQTTLDVQRRHEAAEAQQAAREALAAELDRHEKQR